jgi:predicted small metal-binding protein
MAKEIGCFDIGMYCDFKAQAATMEELLAIVRVHAREVHDLDELPADILEKIHERVRDVPSAAGDPGHTNPIQRIEAVQSLEDLLAPTHVVVGLRRICDTHRRLRAASTPHARAGVVALFVGDAGTGRLNAAEAVANELGLDLYRVDVAAVATKYGGEPAENLHRALDDTEAVGAAVLFFHGTDSIFGARTEGKDDHLRHATLSIDSLIGRLEAYEGVTILTAHPEDDIDPELTRRLRFVVNFHLTD